MKDYSSYWNDREIEAKKPYAVQSPADDRLMKYLRQDSMLERCFLDGVRYLQGALGRDPARVLDVAAGVCWTSALVTKIFPEARVAAVDFSEHRINDLAPIVIEQLQGDAARIERICGDFFAYRPAEQLDAVVFCQALYMFEKPADALRHFATLLRPGGAIYIACERIVPEYPLLSVRHWRRKAALIVKGRADASGRYMMLDRDYECAIRAAGLEYRFQKLDYIQHPGNPWLAGNYFGVKA